MSNRIWLPDDSVSTEMARREKQREDERRRAEQWKAIAAMPQSVTVLGVWMAREQSAPNIALYNYRGPPIWISATAFAYPQNQAILWKASCGADPQGDCSECAGDTIMETTREHETLESAVEELRERLTKLHAEIGELLGSQNVAPLPKGKP